MLKADVVVAGGAGFLGSTLCRRLVDTGKAVVCIDDLSTGRISNVQDLIGSRGFTFCQASTVDWPDVSAGMIFNLATPAGPQLFQSQPASVITRLLRGALNIFEWAERTGARVLIASTSEVYGDPEIQPQKECYNGNVDPVGVRCAYNEGKRAEEAIAAAFVRERHVDVRIARIFNTYGPAMDPDDGRMVSAFILQALRGEDLKILGDGLQTRSLCYVDDMIEGLLRLMDAADGDWTPINLGDPTDYTVRAIAEMIVRLSGSSSRLVSWPARAGEPFMRCPDITRAIERLGWRPTTGIEQGLLTTIDDLKRFAHP